MSRRFSVTTVIRYRHEAVNTHAKTSLRVGYGLVSGHSKISWSCYHAVVHGWSQTIRMKWPRNRVTVIHGANLELQHRNAIRDRETCYSQTTTRKGDCGWWLILQCFAVCLFCVQFSTLFFSSLLTLSATPMSVTDSSIQECRGTMSYMMSRNQSTTWSDSCVFFWNSSSPTCQWAACPWCLVYSICIFSALAY